MRALLVALPIALGCAHPGSAPIRDPEDVTLTPLAEGVFVHTTWKDLPDFGPFPSNGLLACAVGEGLLVDTAWNDTQTARLLDLAEARGCPVRALVVTHAHDDRLGGLAEIRRRGIATWASENTTTRAAIAGWEPSHEATLTRPVRAEVYFPGPAHTPDNVVVWLPDSKVLFGGCQVRAASGRTLGNVADADVPAWPATTRRLLERYSGAAHVVPGHGDPGGPELLTHTLELAEAGR